MQKKKPDPGASHYLSACSEGNTSSAPPRGSDLPSPVWHGRERPASRSSSLSAFLLHKFITNRGDVPTQLQTSAGKKKNKINKTSISLHLPPLPRCLPSLSVLFVVEGSGYLSYEKLDSALRASLGSCLFFVEQADCEARRGRRGSSKKQRSKSWRFLLVWFQHFLSLSKLLIVRLNGESINQAFLLYRVVSYRIVSFRFVSHHVVSCRVSNSCLNDLAGGTF